MSYGYTLNEVKNAYFKNININFLMLFWALNILFPLYRAGDALIQS